MYSSYSAEDKYKLERANLFKRLNLYHNDWNTNDILSKISLPDANRGISVAENQIPEENLSFPGDHEQYTILRAGNRTQAADVNWWYECEPLELFGRLLRHAAFP